MINIGSIAGKEVKGMTEFYLDDPCGGGVVVPAPVVDSLPITILE